MTVTTLNSRDTFVGDGAIVLFAFTFRILENAHLFVTIDDVLQTEITHYTLSNLTNVGGDVTFVSAPANNADIVIFRSVTRNQLVNYIPFDAFPAETHEQALDKLTMMGQDNSGSIVLIEALLPPGVVEKSLMRWNDTTKIWEEFSAYILPLADGSADQVMVTDGAGTLSFEDQTGGGGAPASTIIRKISTADETNATTSQTAHTELSGFVLETGKLYRITGVLWCKAQFSTGGFKCIPFLTEIPDGANVHGSHTRSHGIANITNSFSDIDTEVGYNNQHLHSNLGNAEVFILELEMLFRANATDGGFFEFQFAEITSSANEVRIYEGSWIETEKLD